jgi:hypothetical protein
MKVEIKTITYTTYPDGSPLYGRDEDYKAYKHVNNKGIFIKYKSKDEIVLEVAKKTKTNIEEIKNNYSHLVDKFYIDNTQKSIDNLVNDLFFSNYNLYYNRLENYNNFVHDIDNGYWIEFNWKYKIVDLILCLDVAEEQDKIKPWDSSKNSRVKNIKKYDIINENIDLTFIDKNNRKHNNTINIQRMNKDKFYTYILNYTKNNISKQDFDKYKSGESDYWELSKSGVKSVEVIKKEYRRFLFYLERDLPEEYRTKLYQMYEMEEMDWNWIENK